MATNNITLAETYLPLLDEVYKQASKSAVLDATPNDVKFIGGNKVEILGLEMPALADYSRSTGFVDGAVTATWTPYELTQDRGREFDLDVMDNEETVGILAGKLMSEFIRTQVVPEVDAYRFATYATGAGTTLDTITPAADTIFGYIDTGLKTLADAEVPEDGIKLFVSETTYAAIKGGVTRTLANENGVSRVVETIDGIEIIRVPQGRFYTGITVTAAGGFTNTGNAINFMLVSPTAVWQTVKHEVPRIFAPEINQAKDAWLYQYRLYHDAFVLANKTAGVYVCTQ